MIISNRKGDIAIHPLKLPKIFNLGSATAATQIEGNDTNNNWYQ